MEETEIDRMVEERVEQKWDEKEIGHIKSQAMKLSIILGVIGLIVLLFAIFVVANGGIMGIIYVLVGLVYLVLAIALFTHRTKTTMLIAGVLTLLFGFITGFIPIFIGAALIYYFYKYDKISKKQESQIN